MVEQEVTGLRIEILGHLCDVLVSVRESFLLTPTEGQDDSARACGDVDWRRADGGPRGRLFCGPACDCLGTPARVAEWAGEEPGR